MNNTQSDKDERAALIAEIESELDPQAICQEFMLDHAQWQMILSALRAVPESGASFDLVAWWIKFGKYVRGQTDNDTADPDDLKALEPIAPASATQERKA